MKQVIKAVSDNGRNRVYHKINNGTPEKDFPEMMKKQFMLFASVLGIFCLCDGFAAETKAKSSATRTIRLVQDDAQVRFSSKIYELKHISAEEILPFVNSAILRYSANSTIRRVTTTNKRAKGALLVSTGKEFMPYVDKIVAALDRPGKMKKASAISGTGVTRIAYTPKYRAANEFASIINTTLGSGAGAAYVNKETNTIFWRDQNETAKRILSWVQVLDQPLPQVKIRLNYYELRDSDLKDWGLDYLAWKNGPGVNLLNVGYNAGKIAFDQALGTALNVAAFTSTWGLGGFLTAPQFDMSFIRCLQQSGNANVAAHTSLVMVNTPVRSEAEYAILKQIQRKLGRKAPFVYRTSMQPEYQNIAKNILGRTFIGKSYVENADGSKEADPPELEAVITNPFICVKDVPGAPAKVRQAASKLKSGGVIFDYNLYFKSVVERGNTGSELSNSALVSGSTTLAFGDEKILAVYEKENDVEQTIGIPILCRIPYLRYLFSTVTSIKERTYIIVSAEACPVDLNRNAPHQHPAHSATKGVHRRIENPFRANPKN